MMTRAPYTIAVIGLGYVGLPLAVALARHFSVVGFDINSNRIRELTAGHDRTGEIAPQALLGTTCRFTESPHDIDGRNIFIVTVPTPVDGHNRPDLQAVRAACVTVGRSLRKGAIVVIESTVAPGMTEEVCGPDLEHASGLRCGEDFFLGYSPERINPGDREHTIDRITKVVAGQNSDVAAVLKSVYGAVTSGGVFVARDIKTAEAAKIIENAQRDINIAFINEITMIFARAGISIHDVLEASATKWNFLPFTPGLVGGHCIGVDPYYLAEFAQRFGHHPEIILAGRRINDSMGEYIAVCIASAIAEAKITAGPLLVLGLTFKENVPDLRNSKVVDVVNGLRRRGHIVDVHDPHANRIEAKEEYGIELIGSLENVAPYAAVIGAVAHRAYVDFGAGDFARLVKPGGLVADIKGIWRSTPLPAGLNRWAL